MLTAQLPPAEEVAALFEAVMPFLAAVAAVALAFWVARRVLLRHIPPGDDRRLPRLLSLAGLAAVGVLVVLLVLPVEDTTRGQLLTVLGLLVSAIIALSSTTLVANAMAGLMLRATKAFRTGDFIRADKHFGRVTERGLFHSEIQTEDRELTTLPNLYLITHPVTVVRSSGTIVSVVLSLGYDVHRARVEPLLLDAAARAGLEEPFVRVLELGNFAVTYRVSGFLADIKSLLTARSHLAGAVLDVLHGHGVEVMSPTIMNQRPVAADAQFIPAPPVAVPEPDDRRKPEELIFDKAERAEFIEGHRLRLQDEIAKLEERLREAQGEERGAVQGDLDRRRKQLAALDNAG